VGRALARLAAKQHGVVSVGQLRELGLDASATRRRVVGGQLHPLHRGVYAVGHKVLKVHGIYMAAVLACGEGSALSHRSAAHLWDLRPSPEKVTVTVPRQRAGPSGIQVHQARTLDDADMTSRNGIPVTSLARTLLDLAGILSSRELKRAIDQAERLQLFDLAAVDDVVARARGRRGARALRRAVAAWRPRHTRRELEARFAELVERADLLRPLFNVFVDSGRSRHEVDAFWLSRRLVVELDGFDYHRTRADHERDSAKTADLELAGFRVVRLTWDDVTIRRRETERRLRSLLT
jgi:very-short-patch-repair endonuclease